MNPTLPFDTACADAKRKIANANSVQAARDAYQHGSGILRGYYLAGGVAAVSYKAARDELIAETARRESILTLRAEYSDREPVEAVPLQ